MKLMLSAGFFLLALTSLTIAQPIFDTPVNLGPKINTSAYEADPFWDGPRKRLYFVSARNGSEDIWYSDWTDTGWADAQKLGPQINSSQIELSPSVSPDGQKFYYVTFSRPGAVSVWDIWVSMYDSNLNDWGTPVELPCPVNTQAIEYSGRIGPDGKTLLFYSSQSTCDSINQFSGLVSSVWDSIAGWSIPQSLGQNINAGGVEYYPSITADNKWLYFDRIGSNGRTIFVSPWLGTSWGPAFDLTLQIGARAATPCIVASGDSLFFYTPLLSGFGNGDIFVMELMPTSVESEKETNLPNDFELSQNYPNPFNPTATIEYAFPVPSRVELKIFNILGQVVRTLVNEEKGAGYYQVIWDGKDQTGQPVSSGIYLYQIKAGDFVETKKMQLVK